MEILVTKDTIKINMEEDIHKGEYKINPCEFTFSEDYTQDLVKVAVFTTADKTTYRVTINNDECDIPYEALKDKGAIVIGVYAYKVNGEELQLRYSPRPVLMAVQDGSYIENTEESSIYVPASTIEEYEQQLQDLFADVEASKEEIAEEVAAEASEVLNDYMDQFVKITATGQTINVNDSSNLPIRDFSLLGNATQDETPTPDNPVDVKVVTGDNTVVVNGKNLCNFSELISVTSGNEKWVLRTLNNVNWEQGKTYYIRAFYTPQSNEVVQISNYNYMRIDNELRTITFNGTIPTVRVGANTLNSNVTNNLLLIMVAYETFTTYEPYTSQTQLLSLGNIELAKIGDYTDRIFKSEGKWYKYGAIVKEIFNGSEDGWQIRETSSTNDKRFIKTTSSKAVKTPNSSTVGTVICDKLPANTLTQQNNLIQGITTGIASSDYYRDLCMYITATTNYTLAEFKTWLAENNLTVYYAVETPTTTEITDTTLLGQLENILAMHTNKNVTNAWIEPTGDNSQAGVEIEYRQDLETRLNNIEARLSLLE